MSEQLKESAGEAVDRPEREFFVKPQYRVHSEEDAFELRVVMPGVRKNDVHVSLENSRLTITGTPHRDVPANWKPLQEELARGTYRLELRLNRDIEENAISARVEDGILNLRLPLREVSKPRLIDVN